jgi:hemolysin D
MHTNAMQELSSQETALSTVQALLRFRNIVCTVEELRRHMGHGAVGVAEMQHCVHAYGLKTRSRVISWRRLADLPLPCIAVLRDGRFLLLGRVNHEKAVVLTSISAQPTVISRAEFDALWSRRVIWLKNAGPLAKLAQRLDMAMFERARGALTKTALRGASNTRTAIVSIVNPKPDQSRRLSEELAFLPAALEIVDTPPSPLRRAVAFSIIAVFGISLAWACVGTVDIVAVAPGKIVPSGRTKTIQPLETGVVRAIQVHDGQRVKAGDVLIKLDTTAINAELGHLQGDLMAAELDAARLRAAIQMKDEPLTAFTPPADAPPDLIQMHRKFLLSQTSEQKAKLAAVDSQLAQKEAESATIQASIDKLNATIAPLQQRVEIRQQLFQKELGSKLTYLTELQDLVGQRQDVLVQESRKVEANAAITALTETRAKTVAEYERGLFDELAKSEQKASGLRQDIIKAEQRRNLQRLTAPVDGMVQQLAVHTIGGVVTPAQTLMYIVPAESRLEIEAMVSNRDIGFVGAGQEVAIKVDTFNFTRYGLLRGKILSVSQDSIARDKPADAGSEKAWGAATTSSEPHGQELLYAARISLDRTQLDIEGKEVNLSPGMAVTAEIKTGARRIISYLLSPIARYSHDSLRER